MLRVFEVLVAAAGLILVLSNWTFSLNLSFDVVALISAFLFLFMGIRCLKDDHILGGAFILLVSTMMAFICIESFIPIT